jgi:hypothetical protein
MRFTSALMHDRQTLVWRRSALKRASRVGLELLTESTRVENDRSLRLATIFCATMGQKGGSGPDRQSALLQGETYFLLCLCMFRVVIRTPVYFALRHMFRFVFLASVSATRNKTRKHEKHCVVSKRGFFFFAYRLTSTLAICLAVQTCPTLLTIPT